MSGQGGDPAESFESASFNGLLSVLHKISQGGVQAFRAIVDALFDVLGAAVGLIGTFMDSAIDVGVIGDAWKWVQEQVGLLAADHSALTLGGLVSLAVAIPTTVFYKLMYGVDAQPFPGGVLPRPASRLPQPSVRPGTPVSRSACSRRSSATSSWAWRTRMSSESDPETRARTRRIYPSWMMSRFGSDLAR